MSPVSRVPSLTTTVALPPLVYPVPPPIPELAFRPLFGSPTLLAVTFPPLTYIFAFPALDCVLLPPPIATPPVLSAYTLPPLIITSVLLFPGLEKPLPPPIATPATLFELSRPE